MCNLDNNYLRNNCNENNSNKEQNTTFQDELMKNLRTPEAVQKEREDSERCYAMSKAKQTFDEIKKYLLDNVKQGKYEVENGVTYVSCTCEINRHYLRSKYNDNYEEVRQNRDSFILFRDSTLTYKTWHYYDINPEYQNEYKHFITALNELASREKIHIETVLVNRNQVMSFPNNVDAIKGYVKLCIKATTVVAGEKNYKEIKTVKQKEIEETIETFNKIQEQKNEEKRILRKCILAVGAIVIGLILCVNADFGDLGNAIVMIAYTIIALILLVKL